MKTDEQSYIDFRRFFLSRANQDLVVNPYWQRAVLLALGQADATPSDTALRQFKCQSRSRRSVRRGVGKTGSNSRFSYL